MFNPQRNSSSAAEAVLAFPELLLWTSSVGGFAGWGDGPEKERASIGVTLEEVDSQP